MPELDWTNVVCCVAAHGKVVHVDGYEVTASFEENRGRDNNFYCTCSEYEQKRMSESMGAECEHIKVAKDQFCEWESSFGESQEQEDVCPRCGGPTEERRMAV